MKLLVFGSVNIDHVYRLPHQVRTGETLAAVDYARHPGGKGFNQAVALAKAGQPVRFAGAIGGDGLFLRDILKEQSVDTARLQVKDIPTGHAVIQVDAEGRNAIVLYGGANQAVTEEDIGRVLDELSPGDCLLMQNEISHGDVILRRAAERNVRVALNPSPFTPEILTWPLENVTWFLLNEVEGHDMTGQTEPDAILNTLLQRYPQSRIVLTLGGDGAVYADANQRIRQAAIPVQAVDTTAAGDTFTGYFLHAVLNEQPVDKALKTAALAASIAVSRAGATSSIPTAAEVAARAAKEG